MTRLSGFPLFAGTILFSLICNPIAFGQSKSPSANNKLTEEVKNLAKLGLTDSEFHNIRSWIKKEIGKGSFPGCVLCAGGKDSIDLLVAFGNRQIEPTPKSMKVDTIFDLASLTKPLATGLSVMKLASEKKVQLEDPVSKYLPEFGTNGKQDVTLMDLLTHQSGLIPDNSIKDYLDGKELAWNRIMKLPLRYGHRQKFKYSDVGFQVLGKLVEKVSRKTLDQYADENIYRPLGLKDTEFNPSRQKLERIAPSDKRKGEWIRGTVHDPRSFHLGGVAGHAGLFSSAPELAKIAQMILRGGSFGGKTILPSPIVRKMADSVQVPGGNVRGLSWDKQSAYSSNRGTSFSSRAIGHGGFTGTVFWVDPEKDRFFILLSNRLHPDGKGQINRLAGKIATLIGQK